MENLTHSLVGVALAKAGLEDLTPLAAPVLVITANLPDLDIFARLVGQNYLDFHRGITHSLVGVAALSLASAAVFWSIRRIFARGRPDQCGFALLWLISLAGLASNPALDYLNDYGLRPWLPFSDARCYGDILGIMDPWIWALLLAALCVTTISVRRRILLLLLAAAAGLIVFLVAGFAAGLLWSAFLALAAAAGHALQRRGYRVARLALCAVVVYIGGLAAVHAKILRTARESAAGMMPEPVRNISVLPPRPGSYSRWVVVIEGERRFYIADTGLRDWSARPPVFEAFDKNLDDPCFRVALGGEEMAAMARFVRFPAVTVTRDGTHCTVVLRDLRYTRRPNQGWGEVTARIPLSAVDPRGKAER